MEGEAMTAPILNHTVPEVANTLRCSGVNVYKFIRSGELQAVQFGRRYVVPDSCLREFLERHLTTKAGTAR